MIVKFTDTSDLKGYGFDVVADRVIRFNKHPDGTYLNTRATYSINGRQYTHYEIRSSGIAFQSNSTAPTKAKRRWIAIAACIMLIALLAQCNVSFSFDSKITQTNGEKFTMNDKIKEYDSLSPLS